MAKILIVDDNHDLADAIAALLAQCGHDVSVAYDGYEALSKASADAPQSVLLDIEMPSIDGVEVARRLREEYGSSVRIVACTAYPYATIQGRCRDAPFDAVLVKPARVEDIVEALTGGSA